MKKNRKKERRRRKERKKERKEEKQKEKEKRKEKKRACPPKPLKTHLYNNTTTTDFKLCPRGCQKGESSIALEHSKRQSVGQMFILDLKTPCPRVSQAVRLDSFTVHPQRSFSCCWFT